MQYIIYVMICYNVTDHTAKQSGCAHGAFAIVFYEIASLKCLRLSTHARRDECVHVSLCQFARICVCARVCFYTSHAYIHIQYATCLYTIYIYIYIASPSSSRRPPYTYPLYLVQYPSYYFLPIIPIMSLVLLTYHTTTSPSSSRRPPGGLNNTLVLYIIS